MYIISSLCSVPITQSISAQYISYKTCMVHGEGGLEHGSDIKALFLVLDACTSGVNSPFVCPTCLGHLWSAWHSLT